MILHVYSLADPDTGSPCYVGLTRNLGRRFKVHLRASSAARANPELFFWVDGLLGVLKVPIMKPLEECECEVDGKAAEARWVKQFQKAGFALFNKRGGGTYHTWSPEARKKASETAKRQKRRPPQQSAETKAKIAQKNRERGQDPARFIALNKSRTGVPLSPEHRRKVSEGVRRYRAIKSGNARVESGSSAQRLEAGAEGAFAQTGHRHHDE